MGGWGTSFTEGDMGFRTYVETTGAGAAPLVVALPGGPAAYAEGDPRSVSTRGPPSPTRTRQGPEFEARFRPALDGLSRAALGLKVEAPPSPEHPAGARRFLGWTTDRHWLLA